MPTPDPQPAAVHYLSSYLSSSQSWIYNQLKFATGFRQVVVTKKTKNLELFPPPAELYNVYQLPWYRKLYERLGYRRRRYFPFCIEAVRRHSAAVFHSHGGDYGVHECFIKDQVPVAHVVSVYGADVWLHESDPEWRRRYATMFAKSDLVLAEGNAMRNKLLELGCPPEKAVVQHLGVDLKQLPFEPRQPGPDGKVWVLVAGRSVDKKGHVLAFEAFARVAKRRPEVNLLGIVGGRHDECQRNYEQMLRIIREHHLEDRVRLPGLMSFDQYLEAVRSAHIFLAPSLRAPNGDAEGGAPVTLTELSAGGMPVVASTHCDIPEVILDGRSGLLAKEGNLDELVDRLDTMVAHPERWGVFAREGRRHIEAEYNAVIQGGRLETLYRRAMQSRG